MRRRVGAEVESGRELPLSAGTLSTRRSSGVPFLLSPYCSLPAISLALVDACLDVLEVPVGACVVMFISSNLVS